MSRHISSFTIHDQTYSLGRLNLFFARHRGDARWVLKPLASQLYAGNFLLTSAIVENVESGDSAAVMESVIALCDHGIQVLVTTSEPDMLDGLDLTDDDHRLFVIDSRHGRDRRVRSIPNRQYSIKLSTAYHKGFLGGLGEFGGSEPREE